MLDIKHTLDIKPSTPEIANLYHNHGTYHPGDAGLDVFCVSKQIIGPNAKSVQIKLGISAAMFKNTKNYSVNESYYLYPRSSMGSKTPLRLANSVGIIDAGYRGELIAIVDNISSVEFSIDIGDRFFQICSGSLKGFNIKIVDKLNSTARGANGLGSTISM